MDLDEYTRIVKTIGKKHLFAQGDEAYAYGALLAGCRFFAGYPITPATEAAEVASALGCPITLAHEGMEIEL